MGVVGTKRTGPSSKRWSMSYAGFKQLNESFHAYSGTTWAKGSVQRPDKDLPLFRSRPRYGLTSAMDGFVSSIARASGEWILPIALDSYGEQETRPDPINSSFLASKGHRNLPLRLWIANE